MRPAAVGGTDGDEVPVDGSDRQVRAPVNSRTRILDAAEALFAERGYDGASTAQIAAAAGVSRTLIFHYFPTKKQLLAALLRERGAIDLHRHIPLPAAGDLTDALITLAEQVRSELHLTSGITRIIMRESLGRSKAQRSFTDLLAQLDVLVRDTIHAATAPKRRPEPDVDAAATTFAAVLLRALLLDRFVGTTSDVAPAARVCARSLAAFA